LSSAVVTISQVVFAIPGNYIINKYGLKAALTLNVLCMIIGLCLRCLVNYNFWFVVLGNAISGIGVNIILTGSPGVSFAWFKPDNSPIITSLLMMG